MAVLHQLSVEVQHAAAFIRGQLHGFDHKVHFRLSLNIEQRIPYQLRLCKLAHQRLQIAVALLLFQHAAVQQRF
ncbi:hypothetical protein D3C81_1923200 [compost metagenome]